MEKQNFEKATGIKKELNELKAFRKLIKKRGRATLNNCNIAVRVHESDYQNQWISIPKNELIKDTLQLAAIVSQAIILDSLNTRIKTLKEAFEKL